MEESWKLQSINESGSSFIYSKETVPSKKLVSFWNAFEIVILGLLVALAWALTTLPVIFFHLPPAENNNNDQVDSSVFNGSAACPSAFPYSGVCEQPLTEALLTANCMLDPGDDILVLQNNESTASDLINGLSFLNPSAACLEAVRPFLCLYLFGLCDKTSGVLIQPTIAQCEEIRDSVCAREWALALGFGISLPRCEIFSDELSVCSTQNGSADGIDLTEMLECREGFFREDPTSVCLPSCFTFSRNPQPVSIVIIVVICLSAIIGFVSALAVLIISLIRFKGMFTFPSVFIVYETVGLLVMTFLAIVNYMDRDALFCSSMNLLESLIKVTPFCVISGMVFTYILLQLAVWWLFHTAAIYWKVAFPFHARKFEVAHRIKKIHIACVIIGLLVPLIPIITSVSLYAVDFADSIATSQNVSFLAGGLGFNQFTYPPILCTVVDKDVVFYSLVLPIDVILAVGFLLLIFIFRIVRQQHGLFRDSNSSRSQFKFSTAERKLLFIFWYYVILAAVALTTFTINTRNSDLFAERLLRYFTCEQSGHNPERPCDRSGFESLNQPVLTALSFILLGLFPAVNLIYAINIQELKRKCGVCIKLNVKSNNPRTSSIAVNSSNIIQLKDYVR